MGDDRNSPSSSFSSFQNDFESLAIETILHDLGYQLEIFKIQAEAEIGNGNKFQHDKDPAVQDGINTSGLLSFLVEIVHETRRSLSTGTRTPSSVSASFLKIDHDENEDPLVNNAASNSDYEQGEKDQYIRLAQLHDLLTLAKEEGIRSQSFVKAWLGSKNKFSQHVIAKSQIKDIYKKNSDIDEQIERDCVAFENVTDWTRLRGKNIEKKIQDWKLKLKEDSQLLEEQIHKKKMDLEGQNERIRILKRTIKERLEELAPWEEEKEEERQDRIRHMRRYYSCRKIQRWWKNYMADHGLYKKAKVKAKPKPKNKKNSQKKSLSSVSSKSK